MRKQQRKKSPLINVEASAFAEQYFMHQFVMPILHKDNQLEREVETNKFAEEYVKEIITHLLKGGIAEAVAFYEIPYRIFRDLQKVCFDMIVIEQDESARMQYKYYEKALDKFQYELIMQGRNNGIEKLAIDCLNSVSNYQKPVPDTEIKSENGKLRWKGTPAQFAFIIDLLTEKGYIGRLSPYGERNAKLLLEHFEIEGHQPTPESLGKCFQSLKKDESPINQEDGAKFLRIPHRNDLKR